MKIYLKDFDYEYFSKLPNYKNIAYRPKIGKYFTIVNNEDEKMGVVGVIFNNENPNIGFFQIVIDPKYRGTGILKKCAILIMKKFKIKTLYSSILNTNFESLKSHEKSGFKVLHHKTITSLKNQGFLDKNYTRMKYTGE